MSSSRIALAGFGFRGVVRQEGKGGAARRRDDRGTGSWVIRPLEAHLERSWQSLAENERADTLRVIWTGMRKGELLGLRKSDVDLEHRVLTVARSYGKETTKGGHADAIPIAEPLVPFLADAIARSPSQLVFPRGDGSMWPKWTALEGKLRRTLVRAGLAQGYDHTCRRCKKAGTPHVERHQEAASARHAG